MPTKIRVTTLVLALTLLAGATALANENLQKTTFEDLAENYMTIQTALAGDSIDGVAASANAIAKTSAALLTDFNIQQAGIGAADADVLSKMLPGLQAAAVALAKAETLDAARGAFGDISEAMVNYRNLATGELPHVAYCPMVKKSWLQSGETIANPYYGSAMLRCGSIVDK
jgi:hypothetical protein